MICNKKTIEQSNAELSYRFFIVLTHRQHIVC